MGAHHRRSCPLPTGHAKASHQATPRGTILIADRLRIAFLTNDFPVVSETFVVLWARGLVAAGHEVHVFAAGGASDARLDEREILKGTRGRLRIHRAPGPFEALAYLPALCRLGPKPIFDAFVQGAGPWRARIRRIAGAASIAKAGAFDVVHCQFATLGLNALQLEGIGALRTRALVIHVRGYDVTKFTVERGEDVYRDLFRRADLVIANCEHFKARAVTLGAEDEQTVVIGSPIDMAAFAPAKRPPVIPLRIICVGRLVGKKGVADVIGGLASYRRQGGTAELTIVGDGPLRNELEGLAFASGVDAATRFTGALPSAEVAELLRASHVLIAASVTAADGDQDAPVNTLKEAMATGLPVIGTDHGGIPELVEDGINGYLVPEHDPEAIAAALTRLASEPDRWAEMGSAGRARVASRYGMEGVIERTITAYRSVLATKPRGGGS